MKALKRSFIVLGPALFLLLAAAGPPADQRFEETAQVLAIEVPVNVVGRDGQPVRGLKAADFEVFDEGSRQPITSFEAVDLDVVSPPADAARPAAPVMPATPAGRSSDELESSARRHFLLLFDLSFSNPTAILRARLAAREFLLHSLRPADLAAVATFSVDYGPRLVVTFTPDRAQLARAIDTLGARQLNQGVQRVDPLRFVIEQPVSSILLSKQSQGAEEELGQQRAAADADLLESLKAISKAADKSEKFFRINQVKAMTRSLGDMAKALDSVHGRKHIIYFSEGFDGRLLLGRDPIGAEAEEENFDIAFGHQERVDTDNRYGNTEIQNAVNEMLERFRRADCVIEAVDIGGLRTDGDISDTDSTSSNRKTGQEALFYLAHETGGELFKDANNLRDQLERVLQRTSVTYLLTFQRSDLKLDGSYHRLRVKVNVSGARLSYRTGYFAPRPFQQLDPLEKTLLASDGIASATPKKDLAISLLVTPFRAGPAQSYVPVIIEVGGKSLLAGQTGDKLNVEFYTYVTDERGQMRDFFTQMVGLDIAKGREAMLSTGLKYYGHLDLGPGRYRVRVLVRNAATGKTGVESEMIEVPAYQEAKPELLPPLFFQAPGSWVLVRERARDGQAESVVYPFTVNGQPYVPAAKPSLQSQKKAQLCLVAYNLGKGDLRVDGQVFGADGKVLQDGGELFVLERTATGIDGVDKLLATFQPTGLKAGDYVLRVAVTDPTTGRKRVNSVPFLVNGEILH
ncbi:MAG TPA: VWA domain-containing protein [Thermoanaerobaculia bacterium]|nr:VWA domain-containing protein [Thermoanaerobaculia bacterium]